MQSQLAQRHLTSDPALLVCVHTHCKDKTNFGQYEPAAYTSYPRPDSRYMQYVGVELKLENAPGGMKILLKLLVDLVPR